MILLDLIKNGEIWVDLPAWPILIFLKIRRDMSPDIYRPSMFRQAPGRHKTMEFFDYPAAKK